MLTQHRAIDIHDHARPVGFAETFPDEVPVVAGDEAQILAVGLRCSSQAEPGSAVAHVIFRHVADREPNPIESGLIEHVQNIRLILRSVLGTQQFPVAGFADDAGVVSGDEDVTPERLHTLEEDSEPDPAIAFDAWIRRPAGEVFGTEPIHDLACELLDVIEDVVGNAQPGGDATGVFSVRHRAASGDGKASIGTLPLLHRDPDHIVTGFEHECCGHTAVDATRHRHECLHRMASMHSTTAAAATSPSPGREVHPKLNRTLDRTASSSSPIAAST